MPGMREDLVLAVETSSLRGSVALARGAEPPRTRELLADRRHAAELFPVIRDLLREVDRRLADLTLLCFSRGPGSFTGLRIVATLARMLQSAVGCPVVAVPTLEVIAHNALKHPERPPRLAVISDARRGQVFAGLFERHHDALVTVQEAHVVTPADWLASLEKPVWVLGDAVAKYDQALAACGVTRLEEAYWPPRAATVLELGRRWAGLGQLCQPQDIAPLYIRPPECEEVYDQRRSAARARRGE
jgi:tRNA threonylcarbamoyladenosine biosynthesis protein TsaB